MDKAIKLIESARSGPGSFPFDDLCRLAELIGFVFRHQSGSHRIYRHPETKAMMNFQPDKRDKSKAKPYQVRQLLKYIEEHRNV